MSLFIFKLVGVVDHHFTERRDLNKEGIDFPWLGVCLLSVLGILAVLGALGNMVYLIVHLIV